MVAFRLCKSAGSMADDNDAGKCRQKSAGASRRRKRDVGGELSKSLRSPQRMLPRQEDKTYQLDAVSQIATMSEL